LKACYWNPANQGSNQWFCDGPFTAEFTQVLSPN